MELIEQKIEGLMGEFKSFLGKFNEEKKTLGDALDETKGTLAGLKAQIDELRAYQAKRQRAIGDHAASLRF